MNQKDVHAKDVIAEQRLAKQARAEAADALAAARRLVTPTLDELPELAVVDFDDAQWGTLRAAYKVISRRHPADAAEQRVLDVVNIRCGVPRLGFALRPPSPEQARALAEAAAALAALEAAARTKRDALFVVHAATRGSRGREAARAALEAAQGAYDAAEMAATAARARLHTLEKTVKDAQILDWCRPAP